MWVRFTSDYTFTPDEDRRASVKYPAGHIGNVRKVCADKAIAAGKAEPHEADKPEGPEAAEGAE